MDPHRRDKRILRRVGRHRRLGNGRGDSTGSGTSRGVGERKAGSLARGELIAGGVRDAVPPTWEEIQD